MKRFSIRLKDEVDKKLKNLKLPKDSGKTDVIRRLIKEEADPAFYKIDIEELAFLYNAAGIPMPPELKEQLKKARALKVGDPLSIEQKDALAVELIQREREGTILTDDQADFVNKWLEEERVRRNNRDIEKNTALKKKN